jgi:hypothetical protein
LKEGIKRNRFPEAILQANQFSGTAVFFSRLSDPLTLTASHFV